MKTKSFFAVLILVIAITSRLSSQTEPDNFTVKKSEYLNFSYSAGLSGSIRSNNYNDNTSSRYNYILDVSYTPENNIGFFVNYSSTNLTGDFRNIDAYPGKIFLNTKFQYIQLTGGPRFYTNNKKLFADVGLGYSNIDNRKSLGFNAGVGGKIKLSESYGLMLSGRIYNAFVGNLHHNSFTKTNDAFMYYGLYAGFEINDSKELIESTKNKKSKISLTVLGGKNSYNGDGNGVYAFGLELSYDIKKHMSLITNYFLSKNESYNFYYYKSSNIQNDISGGARIYFGENILKLFLESLVGLYITDTEIRLPGEYFSSNYNASVLNVGLNFGAGTEFKIIEPVSGLVKLNIQNYFRGGSYTGIFGGLKYRF